MHRVCFVCLGNICRSPTAEGVFIERARARGWLDRLEIDSAGTGDWHVGERADARARATAEARGLTLPSISRQWQPVDFDRFDMVVAMDHKNRRDLQALARDDAAAHKIVLFRRFDPQASDDAEVPDPYFGGDQGFEDVFDMCTRAAEGLLDELGRRNGWS